MSRQPRQSRRVATLFTTATRAGRNRPTPEMGPVSHAPVARPFRISRFATGVASLAIVAACALGLSPAGASAASPPACTISSPPPYIHVDSIGRQWLYAQGAGLCYNVQSATVHAQINKLSGSTWYQQTTAAATMYNGSITNVSDYDYVCTFGHTVAYFEQTVWINYTTYSGQHVTIAKTSQARLFNMCS